MCIRVEECVSARAVRVWRTDEQGAYAVVRAEVGEDGAVDIDVHGTGALLTAEEWEAFRDAVERMRAR